MLRSTDRIRTTHAGSLARPPALLDLMRAAAQGRPVDPAELGKAEGQAVAEVVARQRAAGLDSVSDGGQTKTGRARAWPRPGSGGRAATWLQGLPPTMAGD
jgi:5-methyltetrahydropteroyltriglutamate--homocysteine methyltransferase